MALYQAFSPNVEVNGETILSVVDGMRVFKSGARRILEKSGIPNPEPGNWYPQQAWLNAFREISETLGEKILFNIGKRIPANANFPPDIDGIEKALAAIDVAYHMNHRGGDIGSYKYKNMNARMGKMLCETPYPCDFDMGIITAMGERFKPPGSPGVRVLHPPEARCRKRGATGCIYIIAW